MLRDGDAPERRVQKLLRINAALMHRMERIEDARGSSYALTRTAAVLEREVVARNRDLETALADLAAINAELAAARQSADEANRAKSRFLRAASHDLLQPLSAAKLFLSHLSELSTRPEQYALVSHLTATIDSAEELIRALSNIAKLDSRSFEMKPAPVPIGRLFRRLLIDMLPLATTKGIDLRFVASKLVLESDPVFLRQIVQNLIANALKYTTGGKVLVGVRRAGGAVWLEVLDQGPGIAPPDQDRIFKEFERLSQTDQPGTGLGLSIVRRACEQLGHALELHSVPGRGSRFRVCLPVVQMLPASAGAAGGDRVPDPGDALGGCRVLVVENDPDMRRALALLLSDWGVVVRAVGGVDDARRAVAQEPPDLVLTDYRLDGDETGVQTLLALACDLGRNLPAVIISAEPVDAIRAEAAGLRVEVLKKPVAVADLRRAMREALTCSRSPAALARGVFRWKGKHMNARVLVLLLAGMGPAGLAAAGPLSDLLMAPGLLADAPSGEVLRYAHDRQFPGEDSGDNPAGAATGVVRPDAVVDGRVILTAATGAAGPVLVLTLGHDRERRTVAEFPARGSNPILLFFLENVVRTMVVQTGGSPYYIRNRIRDALVASDTGKDRGGIGTVVLHPFETDPNRARMGDFGALTLTLAYDSANPGRLVELLADTGPAGSGYTERLRLVPQE